MTLCQILPVVERLDKYIHLFNHIYIIAYINKSTVKKKKKKATL